MSEHSTELPKQYESTEVEDRLYAWWEKSGFFHATPNEAKKPFTIVIPPPNVTGRLHMGHALNNTLQDILVRYRRMTGRETLWMPGTDHAGIATQNVVERAIGEEGLHREDLGREKFIDRVWEWKKEYGGTIVHQLRKLGCSCDWQRERFTMDEGLSRAVRTVFVRLYEDGLIYRGRRLINWCVRCHSALADDEVEHQDKPGHMWHIRYPIKGRKQTLTVATTRPETMLGDTAVAVHPDDARYKELIGQMVVLPVVGREIPIIADEFVDPAFGTGVVKVTPAHDPNDYECGLRHDLAQIIVIGPDGLMTKDAAQFAGLDRFRCRELLVKELENIRALERVDEHAHAVGHCYRCHSVVEPYLSEQWFVRMKPLAERALAASDRGEVNFHPQRWDKVYRSWLENVRDWCISRQIWWGHRIPVWYCADCSGLTVSLDTPTSCCKCEGKNIRQDEDVLDTWFSSALWPFSTLGWPEKTPELGYFYPTNVLVTARDIIYFWVARMVMMGLHFQGTVPFNDVYIHGTILDAEGRRMSKSLGNGIDPLDMIAQYGADAVRYTLTALTTEGQDVKLAATRFEMGRNFINKLWNASRFVMMNLAEVPASSDAVRDEELDFSDRWILSRLATAVDSSTAALEGFRYADFAAQVRSFAWDEFCDWYVELVKGRIREGGRDAQVAARVLAHVLDTMLRLLHPVTPYMTEEIWRLLATVCPARGLTANPAKATETLCLAEWPAVDAARRNADIEREMLMMQEVIRAIRNVRSKFNIPPRTEVEVLVNVESDAVKAILEPRVERIKRLATTGAITIGTRLAKPQQAASEVMAEMEVYVPLSGLMDVTTERTRLEKELRKKADFLAKSARKLSNQEFVAKAKPEIIERERAQKAELEEQIEKLTVLLNSLGG